MNCNEPSSFQSPASQPGGRPPRTILEVLCREVGAAHPDGALKQIRTMKRLLRSHYHNQQRLQRWGIDGLGEAVQKLQEMREEVDTLRTAQRQRAEANIEALDEALSVLASARRRLHERASQSASSSQTGETPDASPPETASSTPIGRDVDTALRAVQAVRGELDEMRMELWAVDPDPALDAGSPSEDADGSSVPGAAAEALLDRLAGWLGEMDDGAAPSNGELDDDASEDSGPDDPASLLERLQRKQDER